MPGGGATGAIAAVMPDRAEKDPETPVAGEASVAAARPLGVGAGVGEGKGHQGGAIEDGEDATGRQVMSLRFSLARNRHCAGTWQGSSSRWQMGHMPVPTIVRVQWPFIPLMLYCVSHLNGDCHTLP